MTTFEAMRLDYEGGLARLTFTDASRGNPIDGRFCSEIAEVAVQLSRREGLRAVLVTAEGRAFSFGGDIASFVGNPDEIPGNILRWTTTFHSAVARLQRIDAPLVAAVHGVCAGGMGALVAGCDIVIASTDARFVAAYAGIGFSCDGGASAMFVRRMGPARARRFFLLDETLDAGEAQAAGLVDELVSADDLKSRAEAVARRLAAGPTRAFGEMRRLFLTAAQQPLETQLELEAQALSRSSATADAREGLAAFAEKRAANFNGK